MHRNIMWFDTAACMNGGHIGNVNAVRINPTTERWTRRESKCTISETESGFTKCYDYSPQENGKWWSGKEFEDRNQDNKVIEHKGADDIPYVRTYNANQEAISVPNNEKQSWETSIRVDGSMNWKDEDLYRDLLKDYIDLMEDCDVDCQARGSQLTGIAGLLAMVYGLVYLNAIFMFIGTWRYRWRICSLYCTFCVCLVQFVVLILTGAMMFTKYNMICGRSLTETAGKGNMWSMADDFYMTFSCWVTSFITMFCFVCCGMCPAVRGK